MRARVVIGIVMVGAYAFYSSIGLVKQEHGNFEARARMGGKDDISAYEERFSGIRRDLPPFGAVGYLNDVDARNLNENRAAWALTQYALAPLFVVDSLEPGRVQGPWVVGNFHYRVPESVKTERLTLVRDFGNGVFLFTRNTR